ncbi:hypothetical protein SAMN05421847_3020 [Halpernia humi]|uniref:Knr4/Smi1-like domain-containing protein n=1 Tax=Halpernia humi TaxID=493375 RepID=A0A1H6BQ32_9FLAO|nr:SMI1/KNR4 family protein [Halpernia humi]SEG62811.1 hypothetical protein SAMN05421847_3020 [Halpernia humi]
MLRDILNKIEQFGVQLNEKASHEEITNLKKTFDFDFPNDFLDFYLSSNGYHDYYGFEKQHIWNLKKICEENSVETDQYIKFSDHMLLSPWIGYSRIDAKIYKGYGYIIEQNEEPTFLADSFTEFLKMIANDEDALY